MMRYFSSSGTKTHPRCFVGGCLYHQPVRRAVLEAVSSLLWWYDTVLFHSDCSICRAEDSSLSRGGKARNLIFNLILPMFFMSKASDSKNWIRDLGRKKKEKNVMSYSENSFELYFTATLVRKSTGVLIFQKQGNSKKNPLACLSSFLWICLY